jgi:hypothetical protein
VHRAIWCGIGSSKGKRRLGRRMGTWEDNIGMDGPEIGREGGGAGTGMT